jgi:hypothetical protein
MLVKMLLLWLFRAANTSMFETSRYIKIMEGRNRGSLLNNHFIDTSNTTAYVFYPKRQLNFEDLFCCVPTC